MSGEDFTADILDDCTVRAKHRRRHRDGDRITLLRIGLASEELSELPRVSRGDLPLVRLEDWTRGDRGRRVRDALSVDVAELSGSIDDEASERVQCRLSIRAFRNSGKESLLEELHAAEVQVSFGREVVEDGQVGHVRRPGNLCHGDGVESALSEKARGGLEDQLTSLLFLAFSEAWRGCGG
jgi:hypothetical protein